MRFSGANVFFLLTAISSSMHGVDADRRGANVGRYDVSLKGRTVERPHAREQPDPDIPYIEYVKDLLEKFQNGESITDDEIQLLMDKLKLTHEVDLAKVDINTAIQTVLANNEKQRNGKSGDLSKMDLALQAIEYLKDTNPSLYEKVKTDIQNGYAVPGITDIIDPKAGEGEDSTGGAERRLGVVSVGLDRRWPNGQIKYKVVTAGNGMAVYTEHILPAMAVVEQLTSLSFSFGGTVASEGDMVPGDDFVYITTNSGGGGCWADLGSPHPHQSWANQINIGSGCTSQGIIMHEILHCAGMHHQQVASYRDNFVTVNFDNIQEGEEHNFAKLETHGYEGIYDYGSIMHYGEHAFANDLFGMGMTIHCHGHACGQRSSLSDWDIFEINHFYSGHYSINSDLFEESPPCTADGEMCGYDGTTNDSKNDCLLCCAGPNVYVRDEGYSWDDLYCKCLPSGHFCGTTLAGNCFDNCGDCCSSGKNVDDGWTYDDYYCK